MISRAETGKLKLETTGDVLCCALSVFAFRTGWAVVGGNVEIDCCDAKSYLQDDNWDCSFFRCAVVILQPEQVRELLAWPHANSCCYNNWPLVDGIARCVPRKKIPEKQGAGLLLASSSTLRSCLGQAKAFLTRRNHLSASARWADPNLRFSANPHVNATNTSLGNLQIATFPPTGSRPEIASSSRRTLISFYSPPV